MPLTNEQKAHDLTIALLQSVETSQLDKLFKILEEGDKIFQDEDYLTRYKKTYDFLYESFHSEFEE
ncbi:hypothetical protein FI615_001669 [Enterococcus faecium]|uniref:hypothetical protein n=1 Tax=Enterococcus faecium TaxID=1352 RepID=UPI001921E34F|nr:hypothetical protein [Enterococcus faecium]EGP4894183.1 hypothetical protein [Enterococcus faecium]EHK9936733.1 hypothetical protein [Enterococcus faecium]MBL3708804.1 hypothetical protein [Enterococcus faecium]